MPEAASQPRFSVIVPTRERPDTLFYSLSSILAQDFDNYEVVVHDNCSSPATRESVDRLANDKLKYFRSDEPLAMTDSFERAVSFARGEYLIIIGDDDALLPHSLKILDGLMREHRVSAIRWSRAAYNWPTHPFPIKRNSLKIPLGNSGYLMPARVIIQKVVDLELPFYSLPMLYNSAVHRDVVAALKKKCGRVFCSPSPDLASGFAIAYEIGTYLSLESPLAIGGISARSNGIACAGRAENDQSTAVAADFTTLNAKAGIAPHAKLPGLYLLPQIVADPYYHVQDMLFPQDTSLDPDRRKHLRNTIDGLKFLRREDAEEGLRKLREYIGGDSRLRRWFDHEMGANPLPEPRGMHSSPPPRGYVEAEKILGLDTLDFGVSDVHGAAKLCEQILNFGRNGFRCTIRDYHMPLRRQLRSIARLVVKRGEPTMVDCD